LEHRRLSTTTTPKTRLEAETRRRSIISQLEEQQTMGLGRNSRADYKQNPYGVDFKSPSHELKSVRSRSNSQMGIALEDEQLPQATPANSPTVSPTEGSPELEHPHPTRREGFGSEQQQEPVDEEARKDSFIAKQQQQIYKLTRKLKKSEDNRDKEVEILKQQLEIYKTREHPSNENEIQDEIFKWKEKYWKVVYDGRKQAEKYEELQEELEETRKRFLETDNSGYGAEAELKAIFNSNKHKNEQGGTSNDEFLAVKELIERMSGKNSYELMELERANEAVIDQLETKVGQIVQEKSEIETALAERTEELRKLWEDPPEMRQKITQLQTQLEETQSSLQSKQDEVTELKKEHEEILSELKKSKLHFIKQSVVEIERLKAVIRGLNKNQKVIDQSLVGSTRSWLASWV